MINSNTRRTLVGRMEELIKSFKAIMYERLTSSFGVALIISWIVFNWEGLYYLAFQEGNGVDAASKIRFIKEHFIKGKENSYFFHPLLSAIVVSTVFPIFSYLAFVWQEHNENLKRQAKEYFTKNKRLSYIQSQELSKQIFELQKENEKILRERTQSESKLRKDYMTLTNEFSEKEKEHAEEITKLNNTLNARSEKINELDKLLSDNLNHFDKEIKKLKKEHNQSTSEL